jgi:hypothetical protein
MSLTSWFRTNMTLQYALLIALAASVGPGVVVAYAQCSGCDCMKSCGDGATSSSGTRSSSCNFGSGSTPCYWRDCSSYKTCWSWNGSTCAPTSSCGPATPPRATAPTITRTRASNLVPGAAVIR